MLGVTPKGFNTVDVFGASDESIIAVINPEMYINVVVHKSIVAACASVDHAIRVDIAADNGLQCNFGGVRANIGVGAVAPS